MKIFLISVLLLSVLESGTIENKKTCLVPFSDAYSLRYFYHTPFYYDRFDVGSQWLCKGSCMLRYQQAIDLGVMTSFLFDNPLLATSSGKLYVRDQLASVYNGSRMGLGFSDMISKSDITLHRNLFFIDCTIEIARLNFPYYVHIGIPVQRSEHKIDWNEMISNNNQVLKGSFVQEYQPNSPMVSLEEWLKSPSTIIHPLAGVKEYLNGNAIGSFYGTQLGMIPPRAMTLWAIADLYIQCGYDGFCYKNITGGYYGRVVIPTSPSLHTAWNKYIFYPTIGNVGRWEFDLGLNGNWSAWNNNINALIVYFDGYVGFLSSACHLRPFDLNNGFFTRYGMVKIFDGISFESKNNAIRAIDLTTQPYQIGNCVRAECVVDFQLQWYQSFFNLGYSFKLQGKERANCQERRINPQWNLQQNRFAYGFCSQQGVQTPNPMMSQTNWITSLVTPYSDMKIVSPHDISPFRGTGEEIIGVPFQESNQMTKNDIDVNSGIMNMQVLNMIMFGYLYKIIGNQYDTLFGIKGTVAKSPIEYYTPSFWELAIFLELNY